MRNFVTKFLKDEGGASAVEYGVLLALITAVVIGAVTTLGAHVLAAFTTVNTALAG